jgi:hypothetical protein
VTQYSAAGCTAADVRSALGDVGDGCSEHDAMVTAPSARATIGAINLGLLNDMISSLLRTDGISFASSGPTPAALAKGEPHETA